MHELLALGDHVELWPAHVGGSLCGGSGLSHKTSSTIGFERRHNRLLLAMEELQFVRAVTDSLPSRPPNVERIVQINRRPAGATPAQPVALAPGTLEQRLVAGVAVLDCRLPDRFDDGHLPGAINLPVSSPGVGTRAGWALDPEQPVVIVADDEPSLPVARDCQATAVDCAAGMCAAFAASLLRRAGRRNVVRVAGGGIGDLGDYGIELALGA